MRRKDMPMTKKLTRLGCVLAASVAFAGCATTGGAVRPASPSDAAEHAAQTRALAEVAAYCDPQPVRCTGAQRTALVHLLRSEYMRAAPHDQLEAITRRAALGENIRRITRTPAPLTK